MKRFPAILGALLLAAAAPALAQLTLPPGQTQGGAINADVFNANTQSVGFGLASLTPALAVPSTSTAQGGTVITTRTTVITACSGTTGPTLPAVVRFETIILINRSGGSCLIWPSVGAALETALGTTGAANAPFTMPTNTDVTFRPAMVNGAVTWYQ